jgi:hypothetical protein
MNRPRKRLKQAKTVAMGCDPLPLNLDGKEGVSGSSPEEGFTKASKWSFLSPGWFSCGSLIVSRPIPKTYPQHHSAGRSVA